MRVFVCSRDDVLTRIDCDDGSTEAQPVLDGVPVRCVAADRGRVIIGTQGAGVLLSSDGGQRWERMELPDREVFSVAIGPADGTLYVGTEPSRLFVSATVPNGRNLRRSRTSPPASAGASRLGHGPITSAGSHRTRIGGSGCWSPSS